MSNLIEHSFFFTPMEREAIFQAESSVTTRPLSVITKTFRPLWHRISSTFIPDTIAPNAITLFGTACSLQAFHVTSEYYESDPDMATMVAIVLLFVSVACKALDGIHAVRCRSATPLGDMFSSVCTVANHVFFSLTLLSVLGIQDGPTRWYLLVSLQLLGLSTVCLRINAASVRNAKVQGYFFLFTNFFKEAELSTLEVIVLVMRRFFPDSFFRELLTRDVSHQVYIACVAIALISIVMSRLDQMPKGPILLSVLPRIAPTFVFFKKGTGDDMSTVTTIADAVCIGLLCVEVYVSSLSHRHRIHSAVVAICVGSTFNAVFAIGASCLYLIGMLTDISYYTKIPLFVPICNVFIDGVFDMCHVGHKRLMENALKHGNRLIVGVLSDEDCTHYKRTPVMTTQERCTEVLTCKFVSEVVAGSPVDGLTEEFIKKHNIHIVVHGEEYDRADDHYYAVPRKMGITRVAPRTKGMSTSELIRRVAKRNTDDLAAKDKLSGKSTVKE